MAIPVVTVAQIREWETATWATGQTEAEVIRRVGMDLAQCALRMTKAGNAILILAGKGNNGADARAARPHLADRKVDLLDVEDPVASLTKMDPLLEASPNLIIDCL